MVWFGIRDRMISYQFCYSCFVCSLSFCALIHVIILIVMLFIHIHSDRFQRVAESDLEKTSWFTSVKSYTRNRSCQKWLFWFDQGTFVPISANLRSIILSRIVFSEVVILWCNLYLAGKGVWLAIKLSRFTSFPILSCGRHVLLWASHLTQRADSDQSPLYEGTPTHTHTHPYPHPEQRLLRPAENPEVPNHKGAVNTVQVVLYAVGN